MKHVVGVNPLQTTEIEQGAVRMRDSLLNRDAEAHPSLNRFVRISELFLSQCRMAGGRQRAIY